MKSRSSWSQWMVPSVDVDPVDGSLVEVEVDLVLDGASVLEDLT